MSLAALRAVIRRFVIRTTDLKDPVFLKLKITLILPGEYYGNVLVGGRPVCDKLWDAKDAKVVCNNLGFDSSTKAVATIKSSFGSVPANFRVSSVKCDGIVPMQISVKK